MKRSFDLPADAVAASASPSEPAPPSAGALSGESAVWESVSGRWRTIFGGMAKRGYSVEFHDFAVAEPLEWSRSFHDQSLEICINLHGRATFRRGASTFGLQDNEVAIYTVPSNRPRAMRLPYGRHCFYTLEFSCQWLRDHLRDSAEHLKPEIRQFLLRPLRTRAHVECFTLPPALIPMRFDLLAPPAPGAAADAWYFGKMFEIIALTLYQRAEPVGASNRRNRERVERARALMDRSFENPPSLADLAGEAGCSPFHLSRMFRQELGVTISAYQRAIRMEKAAEYLREGRSVTETAMAVGYSNVSAFIKAFDLHHCTTPSRWMTLSKKKEEADRG